MRYFNCHVHTFNMQYVPRNFLKVNFNDRIANALHWLLNQKVVSSVLLWVAKKIIHKGTSAKMLAFLTIGLKKTQDLVFRDLVGNYPKDDEVKFIILPMDFKFMGAGELNIAYEQQLEDLFDLKLTYPNQCYPFVAIDPRRGSAAENLEFVKRYIDRGFSGIKLYPALGYFSFDRDLELVYKYAEANNIPLMTHCSTGGINYVQKEPTDKMVNPIPFYRTPGKSYRFPQNGLTIDRYCDQLSDPENFEEALTTFPDLKICFSHLGLNAKNKFTPPKNSVSLPLLEWYDKIIQLMLTYKKVYTDISYSVAYDDFCIWFKYEYSKWPPDIQERVLFGTDYFMTVQEVHGNDDEILKAVLKQFDQSLFEKLAYTNVINYLKRG